MSPNELACYFTFFFSSSPFFSFYSCDPFFLLCTSCVVPSKWMEGRHVRLCSAIEADVERQRESLGVAEDEDFILLVEYVVLVLERCCSKSSTPTSLSCRSDAASSSSIPLAVLPLSLQPRVAYLTQVSPFVHELLTLIQDYASQGALGNVNSRVCDQIQPLLVRMMKLLTSLDGSAALVGTEDDVDSLMDLLDPLTAAMSACAGGCAGKHADALLLLEPPFPFSPFSIRFGFGEFTDCQTGSQLWAGSVGLSLWLIERAITYLHPLFLHKVAEQPMNPPPPVGQVRRIIELGCGTGLLSLVLVQYLLLTLKVSEVESGSAHSDDITAEARVPSSSLPLIEVHVTDLSSQAVREVFTSFTEKNGKTFNEVSCFFGDCAESCMSSATRASAIRVYFYPLDMCRVPPTLKGMFNVVLAGDVVYDFGTTPFIYPALSQLLSATPSHTSIAILCCEAHRDGMKEFIEGRDQQADLALVEYISDLSQALKHFTMWKSLCTTKCRLVVLEKTKCVESVGVT